MFSKVFDWTSLEHSASAVPEFFPQPPCTCIHTPMQCTHAHTCTLKGSVLQLHWLTFGFLVSLLDFLHLWVSLLPIRQLFHWAAPTPHRQCMMLPSKSFPSPCKMTPLYLVAASVTTHSTWFPPHWQMGRSKSRATARALFRKSPGSPTQPNNGSWVFCVNFCFMFVWFLGEHPSWHGQSCSLWSININNRAQILHKSHFKEGFSV